MIKELGAEEKEILTVYNKIDRTDDQWKRLKARNQKETGAFISCRTGKGIDELLEIIESKLDEGQSVRSYLVPHEKYALVSRLREQGSLVSEETAEGEGGVRVEATPRGKLDHQMEEFLLASG